MDRRTFGKAVAACAAMATGTVGAHSEEIPKLVTIDYFLFQKNGEGDAAWFYDVRFKIDDGIYQNAFGRSSEPRICHPYFDIWIDENGCQHIACNADKVRCGNWEL